MATTKTTLANHVPNTVDQQLSMNISINAESHHISSDTTKEPLKL